MLERLITAAEAVEAVSDHLQLFAAWFDREDLDEATESVIAQLANLRPILSGAILEDDRLMGRRRSC